MSFYIGLIAGQNMNMDMEDLWVDLFWSAVPLRNKLM